MTQFRVQGITCMDCAEKFRRRVADLPGVRSASLNTLRGTISIEGGVSLEGAAGVGEPAAVTVAEQGPNQLTLHVQPTAPGYLVLSQPFYPGWGAVDQAGRALPIVRANFAFQAVPVGPDTQSVTLRFQPAVWMWGWVLAGIGGVIVVVGSVAGGRRRAPAGHQ